MEDSKANPVDEVQAEDPDLEARLDAEALADYSAGRVVSHAKVVEWLRSWGTDNPVPRPKPEPQPGPR